MVVVLRLLGIYEDWRIGWYLHLLLQHWFACLVGPWVYYGRLRQYGALTMSRSLQESLGQQLKGLL